MQTAQWPAVSDVFSPSHFIGHWYLAFVLVVVEDPQDETATVHATTIVRNKAFMGESDFVMIQIYAPEREFANVVKAPISELAFVSGFLLIS